MGEEYRSFHYLNHKEVKFQPNFVKDPVFEEKPPTFEELWCSDPDVTNNRRLLKKEEKFYWRTRHRVEYIVEELRSASVIMVSVRETETDAHWRPLVIDTRVLFPLIDSKKILEPKTRKPKEGLDEAGLARAASDYIIGRLLVTRRILQSRLATHFFVFSACF
mmetsp:Transcript_52485/g.119670  ORF Transcript_52485/g.119670 Transcript_52485/m.119670 type:complete len:163 (-) Transcript_52485:12-500(-)